MIEPAYGYIHALQARGRFKVGEGIIGRVVEMSRPNIVVLAPDIFYSMELSTMRLIFGYCHINLEVREDNVSAKTLYKKWGFRDCVPKILFWEKKI